ncbi:MAG: glycosyltransferase family 39 protein [Holophagales bacterium]|nr:glycosyltransferase family 39 protein [Holophagales bacterium]
MGPEPAEIPPSPHPEEGIGLGAPRYRITPLLALGSAVLVLLVHGVLLWLAHEPAPRVLTGDELRYVDEGRRLAAGEEVELDPLWPPLYSRFLASIFAAGGGLAAVQVVQTLLLVGGAWLLWRTARTITGSATAAGTAAGLMLAYPPLVAFAGYFWPEVLHLTLFLAALCLLVEAPAADPRRRPIRWLGAGLCLALALLAKKILWPFVPVLLLMLAWARGEGPDRRGKGVAGGRLSRQAERWRAPTWVMAGMLLLLVPAAVAWGPRAISPASSALFNLWVGLDDRGMRSFEAPVVYERYLTYRELAPEDRDRAMVEEIRRGLCRESLPGLLGQQVSRQYRRLFHRHSFLTDQLPGGALAQRGRGYADPPPALARAISVLGQGSYSLLLMAPAVGVVVAPFGPPAEIPGGGSRASATERVHTQGRRFLALLLIFLVYNLILFLGVHVKSRYRIQLLPVLFLYAGLLVELCRARYLGRLPRLPAWRWTAGAALGVLLLLLGWADRALPGG